ncbi:MAG: heterodisulfide reductase-related iron-sulfur binding cluster [Segniliparus sp.]|uniref:(Fe-S)-binding protein n=1 Tax=Segniliparus sp. TaxID=2804064 RepID=UPI003F3D5355
MNATTIAIGIVGWLICLVCWGMFFSGVWRQVRIIRLGQPDNTRLRPVLPRLKTLIVEFLAHTRMVQFRSVGWAHWLVMIGFLGGMFVYLESYGRAIDPEFHWPVVGELPVWHLWEEFLGVGTIIGIVALIVIRQLNHPRRAERLSRFAGSNFFAAYLIELIVLTEGTAMVLVKAMKIATFHETSPWTDPVTGLLATLFPASTLMVSVFSFFEMLSGGVFLFVVGRKLNWGVAWHRFSAFFNIYFKREADGGVALGAAKPMMSGGKVLNLEEADPDEDSFGVGKIEDFTWKNLLDFTTCTECGRCQSQCPAWNTGKPLSPKLLITSLRDHAYAKAPYLLNGETAGATALAEAERPIIGGIGEDGKLGGVIDPEVLWSCTTCGACVEQCPVDIEHVDHIIDLRRHQVLIETEFPHELSTLFKNLENKGNPWGQNSSARTGWIGEVDFPVPVFGEDAESFDGYEYLFWVGCAGAYEDRAKKTTKAVAELLYSAEVEFLVLGAEETCTGDSARRSGNEMLFQALAQQNIATIDAVFEGVEPGRRKIVVTCAHCFNALKNEYPELGGAYEVVHHTQLLNKLVREKKLVPVAPVEGNNSLTYHDPCYLGRHNKVYEAPRELIEAAGAKLTEMPRHGQRSMCCGAGGARMWMEETLGKRINIDRVDEAIATNAQTIASGCPFCRVMLTDGVTAKQQDGIGENVQVVDVAQLLLESVRRGGPLVVREEKKAAQTASAPAVEKPAPSEEPAAQAAPAAEAPKTDAPQAAKPSVGLGIAGPARRPGAKQPAPAAPAETAPEPAGQETSAAAKPSVGLGIAGPAKRPGAKKPVAAPAPSEQPAEAAAPAEPKAEAPAAKPAVGLGIAGPARRPGAKKPAPAAPAEAATPEPAAAPAEEPKAAPAEPVAAEPVAAEPKQDSSANAKPTVGLGIAGLAKRPGAKKPAPAAPAEAEAPAQPAPQAEEPAPSEPPAAEAERQEAAEHVPDQPVPAEPEQTAEPEPAQAPAPAAEQPAPDTASTAKPAVGLGIAPGAKRPGRR